MKRIILILILTLSLSTVARAETSSTYELLENLSKTWNSLVKVAEENSKSISEWAEKSGVKEWAEGAIDDVNAWIAGGGLSEWADNALSELSAWANAYGFSEWAERASGSLQAFIDKNGPAIEAWLQQAGQEVTDAWNTLVNSSAYSEAEVKKAYQTVTDALTDAVKGAKKK